MQAVLNLGEDEYREIVVSLLPPDSDCEEAAFGFAKASVNCEVLEFQLMEWICVPIEGFASRSPYFLHLSDEVRAGVIKHAHDLQLSLIEFHSHPFQRHAEFSPSDWSGFEEFVPHVRWRLKKRPYAAFVFGSTTFDALAWDEDVEHPIGFKSISWGRGDVSPTGLSISNGRIF